MKRKSLGKGRRLGFEGLEQRRMMAGDISFDDGVVTIEGDNGFDSAEVTFEGDDVSIDLLSQDLGGGDFDDHHRTYDLDNVDRIVFLGFDGNDVMSVEQAMLDAGVDLSQVTIEFYGGNQTDTFFNNTIAPSIAYGGAHIDFLTGGLGDDDLFGEGGNDILEGRQGDDYLHGGLNDDTYVFSGGDLGLDTIAEQNNQGIDKIDLRQFNPVGSTSSDVVVVALEGGVYGGFAIDHLQINIVNAQSMENVDGSLHMTNTLIGNGQANTLKGASYRDYLGGMGGVDTLYGYGGNDHLSGGTGGDSLYGGSGDDYMLGDEDGGLIGAAWGNLVNSSGSIDAADFNALLFSYNSGNELEQIEADENAALYGARDYLFGEIGNDVMYGGSGDDVLHGGRGNDWMFGGNGLDDLHGDGSYDTSVDGDDFLYGGSGADDLYGRGGNDRLEGGDGRDNLFGHGGNDLLLGSYDGDQDVLNGGAGTDTFVRYRHLYQMWTSRGLMWFSNIINEELEQDFTSGEDNVQYLHV